MALMKLKLQRIPNVLGIYGASKNQFPARMSLLRPDAAAAFEAVQSLIGQRLRVSDMYRTPAESLTAMQTKRGVQPPGYSAHNFGLAIDIDTDSMLAALKVTKPVLDTTMQSKGWYCHRKDGQRGMEDWHYNYLGDDAGKWLASASATSTSGAIEAKIAALHPDDFAVTATEAQEMLKQMGLYSGAIDGAFGAVSIAALKNFQVSVRLPTTGQLDAKTQRTLAVASCTLDITESQGAAAV